MRRKLRKVMMEYGKRPSTTYQSEEYLVVNSGKRVVTDVEVGGRQVHLLSAGATVYDKNLAFEIKDKYRNDPNVMVIQKPWVRLNDGHVTHHVVPELPWHKQKRRTNGKEVDPKGDQETGGA